MQSLDIPPLVLGIVVLVVMIVIIIVEMVAVTIVFVRSPYSWFASVPAPMGYTKITSPFSRPHSLIAELFVINS